MSRLARLSVPEALLAVLWAGALVSLVWPDPLLRRASGLVMALYVIVALGRARGQIRLLCTLLGLAAAAGAWWTGRWDLVPRAIESAVVFAAFFGTLTLLRATADLRPEIARARAAVARIAAEERTAGYMIGAHLLGAVLVVGALAVIAPIVGRDAPDAVRKAAAEASQRGLCTACLWSPFWIAMAISYQHLPGVALWQIMALGLAMAALALVLAQAMFARAMPLAGLGRAVRSLAPVMPPVAVCAAAVVALTALGPFTTLQALITAVPALSVAGLLAQGAARLKAAAAQTWRGMATVGGEIALLTFSLVLGRILEAALAKGAVAAMVAAAAPPPAAVIATIVIGVGAAALVGIHQIVTVTVLLVLFASLPLGVSDLVLMESALLGWAFASMTGISAVSVAVAGAMFAVPIERVAYGPNLRFVAALGTAGIALLTAVNAVLA